MADASPGSMKEYALIVKENPARDSSGKSVEKQAGESKAPRWRLCSPHRPAEPGGNARNYGLFQDSQGGVR